MSDVAPRLHALAHLVLDTARMVSTGRAGFLLRFASGGVAFTLLALLLRRASPTARTWGLTAGSIAVLTLLTTPAVAAIAVLYTLAFYAVVERLSPGRGRLIAVVGLLVLQMVGPILWLPLLPGYEARVREYMAFATNLTLLRSWGYAYDRLVRPEPTRPLLRDYLLFTFFFPAFVNGPLVSHTDFARARTITYWAERPERGLGALLREERHALGRIAFGVALALVTMFYVCVPGTAHFEAAVHGGMASAWSTAVRVYVCWYLSFSAWTEVAIGFGRLAGVALPENFNAPHFAYGTADFWRRWNITFMVWLRRYVYLPLGGAYVRGRSGVRHLEWRNTAAVFAFVAAYHLLGGLKLLGPGYFPPSSYVPWTVWAVLNASAVIATRGLTRPARLGVAGVAVVATTFAFSCLGHMTAMFPPGMPLRDLATIYRHLVLP